MRSPAGSSLGFQIGTAVLLASGCGGTPDRAVARDSTTVPAESLAVSAASGLEIWYTLARSSRSAEGASCIERGLEIRRGDRRVRVPLLYTAETPTLINDSTMRAVLWTNCRAVKPYLVDLRTGQPEAEQGTK